TYPRFANEHFLQTLASYSHNYSHLPLTTIARSNMLKTIMNFKASKKFGVMTPPPLISLDWKKLSSASRQDIWEWDFYWENSRITPQLLYPSLPIRSRFPTINRYIQEQQVQANNHPGDTIPYLSHKIFSPKHAISMVNPDPKNIAIHT